MKRSTKKSKDDEEMDQSSSSAPERKNEDNEECIDAANLTSESPPLPPPSYNETRIDASDASEKVPDSNITTTVVDEDKNEKTELPHQTGIFATLPLARADDEEENGVDDADQADIDDEEIDNSNNCRPGAIAVRGFDQPIELEESESNTFEPSGSNQPNESATATVTATLVVDEAPEHIEEILQERVEQLFIERLQQVNTVAIPEEGDDGNKPVTKPSFWQGNKRCLVCLGFLAGIIVVVVIVSVVVVVSKNKHTISPNIQPPTMIIAPTTSPIIPPSGRLDYFRTLLVQQNVSDDNNFKDITTAQHQALSWLSNLDTFSLQLNDKVQVIERYIMAVLYFATGKGSWSQHYDFLSHVSICSWTNHSSYVREGAGVKCVNDQASDIILVGNNLKGSIPSEIGKLSRLTRLSLSYNILTGTLPTEIGLLHDLESLDLSLNRLAGSIPSELWSLSKLTLLDMSSNILIGALPDAIGNLHALQSLDISYNNLTGILPDAIGNLHALQYLRLSSNQLTGTLPESIGNLYALQYLELCSNKLTGILPKTIGNLNVIVHFELYSNKLAGPIPTVIASFSNLARLELQNNNFNGTLPSEIDYLTQLYYASFANNTFSGSIPSSIGQLTNLSYLYLHRNKFTGTVPSILASLSDLHDLFLYHNQFYGNLTTAFCNQGHVFSISADCRNNANLSCGCCKCY